MNKIITIGREFGSGGREFGRRLAEALGYEYYDREIIEEIASRTELSENYVKQVLEKKPHPLFPITIGSSLSSLSSIPLMDPQQKVYQEQSRIIKEMAEQSDCVIVGRCADYILSEQKPYRIFVYADMESRIKRCIARSKETEKFTAKEIRQYIQQMDKARASYYNFYTGQKWSDMANYDLCINTTDTDIKALVDVIAKMFL